jgi:hypothetical protein
MASLREVLNEHKKARRLSFLAGAYIEINDYGSIVRQDGSPYIINEDDLFLDNWEPYKEPEQLKVCFSKATGCFYFAARWDSQDTEATPEQLRSIRAALGIDK